MTSLAYAAALVLAMVALAQQPPSKPPACTGAEYQQFDFWIGEWVVHNPKGTQVGTNRIEKIENGCGLQETWRATGGGTGRSLNFYRPATKTWTQAWVGGGASLLLEGTFDGRRMRLEGDSIGAKGARVRDRITWTPQPQGTVRQHWEQSSDNGKTWTTAFDGTYSRVPAR